MENPTPTNPTPAGQQPTGASMQTNADASVFKEKGGTVGPMVGIIIVVAVLIIGGVYYFMKLQAPETTAPATQTSTVSQEEPAAAPDAQTQALATQSSSTNLADIQSDLNATDLNNLSGNDLQGMGATASGAQ